MFIFFHVQLFVVFFRDNIFYDMVMYFVSFR